MNISIPFQNLRVGDQLISVETPRVMGIFNVTPDSFYSGSRVQNEKEILEAAAQKLEQGATFLDIGGYSSRPGASDIPQEEEINRTIPAIASIMKEFPFALISVDTFRSEVARRAVDHGAALINDISGGQLDPGVIEVAAQSKVPYVLMHMRGTPQSMAGQTDYQHLVKDLLMYFASKIELLQTKGIADIIIDPGFGFAKTADQNFELLQQLDAFKVPGRPLMVGLSRKSMIWKTLNISADQALNGTSALHMSALMKGANILRVHDVAEAMEVVKLFNHLKKV